MFAKAGYDKTTLAWYVQHIGGGGHINVGETPWEAALRECREEIGVTLDVDKLHFIGTFRVALEPQNIRFVFGYQVHGEVDFTFNDGEVESMEWMSLSELEARLADPDGKTVIALYGEAYAALMLEQLRHQAKKAIEYNINDKATT